MTFDPWLLALVGIVLVALGIGLGISIGRRGDARSRALEAELAQVREDRARYQEQVAQHFGRTATLFRDLTQQYGTLWQHLASGARDLCPERVAALEEQLGQAPVLLTSEPAAAPEPAVDDGAPAAAAAPPAAAAPSAATASSQPAAPQPAASAS
ncbi:MAG: DUF1043 family protein [bacterium]|nr:DUF1043 family protein [bacterium]